MIGPKKQLSNNEQRIIKKDCSKIEQKLSSLEHQAEQLCDKINNISDKYANEVSDYLVSQGIKKTALEFICKSFCDYTPNICYNTDNKIINKNLTPEQFKKISLDRKVYRAKVQRIIRNDAKTIKSEIEEKYQYLIKQTAVETICSQLNDYENVILYVVDGYEKTVSRVETNLTDADEPKIDKMSLENALQENILSEENIANEVRNEKANVYVVTNPSDRIRSEWVIDYVIDELIDDYAEKCMCTEDTSKNDSFEVKKELRSAKLYHGRALDRQRATVFMTSDGDMFGYHYGEAKISDEVAEKLLKSLETVRKQNPVASRQYKKWIN